MISTLVRSAPAGFGGSGNVRASTRPWASLLAPDGSAGGGAMPTAVRDVPQLPAVVLPAVVLPGGVDAGVATAAHHRRIADLVIATGTVRPTSQPFSTTNPYSTLGNHSPGRPRS